MTRDIFIEDSEINCFKTMMTSRMQDSVTKNTLSTSEYISELFHLENRSDVWHKTSTTVTTASGAHFGASKLCWRSTGHLVLPTPSLLSASK